MDELTLDLVAFHQPQNKGALSYFIIPRAHGPK